MHAIDMYKCSSCQSLTTFPMPSEELLAQCYSALLFGYPSDVSRAKRNSRQGVWYDDILDIFDVRVIDGEIIADVGAGEGLLVEALSHRSKLGVQIDCYDYHSVPPRVRSLQESSRGLVNWIQSDLSLPDWAPQNQYVKVFCISVIEHVREPRKLVADLLRMCRPGGNVYVIGPCTDSLFHRLLKSRWPYIIPGEHLTIPSLEGIALLLKSLEYTNMELRKINVSYSVKYVLDALLKMNTPVFLDVILRLPLGVFAATITKR